MILQAYKRRFARLLMESPVLAVGPGQEQAGHTFLYLPIQRVHFGGRPNRCAWNVTGEVA